MLIIGLDPGTYTGYAESEGGKLIAVETLKIHRAMERILFHHESGAVMVYWEDPRKRRWFGKSGPEVWQGAGSIKRDGSIWEDFFVDHGIPNTPLPPQAGLTGWNKEKFARYTGWTRRTSEHGRDAACLILGRKAA